MTIKHRNKQSSKWKIVLSVLLLAYISNGSFIYKNESSLYNRNNTGIPKYFLTDSDQPFDKCHQINLVNKIDQCQFAIDYCSLENLGFINYLKRYYCSASLIGSYSILAFNALRLVTLFTILGIAASDYLSPNLNTTAKLLHIGENLAGLTLLAFGNGSPDLISTFIAMKANSAPLAISELVGAALFITSMVVGLMSIIHPFKVPKFIYIRDTVYFLISTIVVSYFILIKQAITADSCLIFSVIYLLYVCLILIWHLFTDRKNKKKLQHRKFRDQFFDDPGNSTGYQDSTISTIPLHNNTELPTNNLESASENRNIEDILAEDSEYSSLSLSFNPFSNDLDNESSNAQQEGISNKSITSISSRVLSTADSGYITYRDIVAPGMIASDDNFIYNIHEENEDFSDEGDEVANNQFFVRPSLMNALQLGKSVKMNDNLDSERISEINQILETSDNISMKSISNTARYDDLSSDRSNGQSSRKHNNMFLKFFNKFFNTKRGSIELGNENISSNRVPEIIVSNDATENQDINAEVQSSTIRNVEDAGKIQAISRQPIKDRYFKLIFPSLMNFDAKTAADKILTVIILPSSVLLRLSTPSIEFINIRKTNSSIKKLTNMLKVFIAVSSDDNDDIENRDLGNEINQLPEKILFCERSYEDLKIEGTILPLQSFVGSTFFILSTFDSSKAIFFMPILGIITFTMALVLEPDLLDSFKKTAEIPTSRSSEIKGILSLLKARKFIYYYSSISGFLISLLWISFLAKEVVSALKFYSVVFSLSDEILGFTVFAVGNSLGDLIANFVIAKMGFPRMALAACFGGPLLNILLGVAIGGFFALPDTKSIIEINSGLTLWVSCISLILNLVFLITAVPNNNWKMNSHIGYVCMCFWVTATLTNIIFEIVK